MTLKEPFPVANFSYHHSYLETNLDILVDKMTDIPFRVMTSTFDECILLLATYVPFYPLSV